MKKKLLLLAFWTLSTSLSAAQESLNALLQRLDREVAVSKNYDDERARIIDSVRKEWLYVDRDDPELRYKLSAKLVSLYYKFDYDSTMVYVLDMFSLANTMKNKYEINNTRLHMASLLVSGGLFTPSVEELSKIDKNDLDTAQLISYYSIHASSYYGESHFINDDNYSVKYKAIGNLYQDSLVRVLQEGSDEYNIAKSRLLVHRFKDYQGAFELLGSVCERMDKADPEFAKAATTLAMLYGKQFDFENQKRMLAMASICNIRNSTKETTSILELSQMLYKEGDIDRAHRYVKQSWEEATSYNARHRKVQISTILPLIETERSIQEEAQKKKIIYYSVIISLLTLLTVALLAALYLQLVKVNRSKKNLEEANEQLAGTNRQLRDSNQIKNKYLIDFFDVCSEYITKMGRWQVVIRKKLKEKRYDELFDMLDPSVMDSERQALFITFDSIFLTLFPTFIEDFNNLLEPDSRIVPKKTELLNKELRIFSLVRLGITDPVHIAKFLNCTVNTVYTYRTKIKSRAINQNRNEFEKDVMKIGMGEE